MVAQGSYGIIKDSGSLIYGINEKSTQGTANFMPFLAIFINFKALSMLQKPLKSSDIFPLGPELNFASFTYR